MGDPLIVWLDVSELIKRYEHLAGKIQQETDEAAEKLSFMTHTHIVDEASSKLNSVREEFLGGIIGPEKIDDHIWTITIPEKLLWIEEGIPNGFDMLPGLLKNAKRSGKNGKYAVIPFKHNKKPTQQTSMQQALTKAIKSELTKRKLPYGNLEMGKDGKPQIGLLHKFDLNKPKQGGLVAPPHVGPHGRPWQASPRPGGQEGPGGRPYLWNVRIYQREVQKKDGSTGVQRDIMTFRTASEKHSGSKWIHPGFERKGFLDEAHSWAQEQWENVLLPELMKTLGIDD